jgi:type 1 fimbria pilin
MKWNRDMDDINNSLTQPLILSGKSMFNYTKVLTLLGFSILSYAFSSAANAATCGPKTSTKIYNFNMNYTLSTPSENTAGMLKLDAFSWNTVGNYSVRCDCIGKLVGPYFTAKVPESGGMVYSDGTYNYYAISPYLAVASSVYVAGALKTFIPTPFHLSNQNTTYTPCEGAENWATGNKGTISLYFRRAFVGIQTIPMTKVVDIYVATDSTSQSTIPVSTVYMSGTVTVPQSCTINGGGVITIPFGDIVASDIKTKGEMAKGFVPKNQNFNVMCNNISEGVKVSLSFQGKPDPNEPSVLATNNENVGVKIENASGSVITPVSGQLPLNMNYASQSASSQIKLYPINTTGRIPGPGNFTATATIQAEIQ